MILWLVFFVLLMLLCYGVFHPCKTEWLKTILGGLIFSLLFAIGISYMISDYNIKTTPAKSTNVALVTIAGDYYAVGHVNKAGELNFVMINGDDYSEITCPNQRFSRTNSLKSDVYLEIQHMKYVSPFMRWFVFNFTDNVYILHAPQHAVLLDVPY